MKKLTKDQWINIAMLIGIILILFTPVGFHAKVYVNKLVAFTSPSIAEGNEQVLLAASDWELYSDSGKRLPMESLKGKVVVLNFWATWCPPCVAEMPNLQALYDQYGKEVVFLFIAHDKADKVNTFLKKNEYNLPVFYEGNGIPDKLFSKSIPITFILDKSGAIVVKEKGAANWNAKKVTDLLDGLLTQ